MSMLTTLGARLLTTINPTATSVLFEKAFDYLVVGVGGRTPSAEDYVLELPLLRLITNSCGAYCSQQGTVFEQSATNELIARTTVVREWTNTYPYTVFLKEFGFGPNSAGYPLAIRELFRDSNGAPSAIRVDAGQKLPASYTLAIRLRPWGLAQRQIYADGVLVNARLSFFASSSALYPQLFVPPPAAGNLQLYYDVSAPPALSFPVTSVPLPATYVNAGPSDIVPPLVGTAYFWGGNFDLGAVAPVRYVVLTWGSSVSSGVAQYGLFIDFGQEVSFRNSYMAFGAMTAYGQVAIGW